MCLQISGFLHVDKFMRSQEKVVSINGQKENSRGIMTSRHSQETTRLYSLKWKILDHYQLLRQGLLPIDCNSVYVRRGMGLAANFKQLAMTSSQVAH